MSCPCPRLYTLQQYSKLADDFQRKQLGASGTCPARTVEVSSTSLQTLPSFDHIFWDIMFPGLHGTVCEEPVNMQNEYWRQRKVASDLTVEYGNDVEGTAFCSPSEGDPLGSTDWNLQAIFLL